MIFLLCIVIFLAGAGGIVGFSLLTLRFVGQAMNAARARDARAMAAVFAALSAGAIAASAAGGFLGIALVLYTTQP